MTYAQGIRLLPIGALLLLTGCSVRVNKDGRGEDRDVSVHTPFGGVEVNKDKTGAAALGLPAYPGAVLNAGNDGDSKSVDLHLGFAQWQVHVQVADYTTRDPQAKVEQFYKAALARYGAVLTCRGNAPVNAPARTGEGLTCDDESLRKNAHLDHIDRGSGLQLKAGSERRQHIVAFDEDRHAGDPATHFTLIALALPDALLHERDAARADEE